MNVHLLLRSLLTQLIHRCTLYCRVLEARGGITLNQEDWNVQTRTVRDHRIACQHSSYAQDRTNEIDEIFSWVTPGMPGCAVAVSQHGELVVNRAYGLADLERDVPLSPGSVFDAASIRKQFVAAAVFLLVEEGRLSLSDDVRTYVPELPDYGHEITLDHLLTHTSGLRDWVPLRNWATAVTTR